MVDGDGFILDRLQDDYGRDWTFGRTMLNDQPHWWMATRTRRLSDEEMERGLSASLIYDTARLMRQALEAQKAIERREPGTQPPEPDPAGAAWIPVYL